MTTLTQREQLTPGQELVQGAYESGLEPMRQPRRKALQEAYGFDDVAIVPGAVTINPETDRRVDGAGGSTAGDSDSGFGDGCSRGSAFRGRGGTARWSGGAEPGGLAVPLRRSGRGAGGGGGQRYGDGDGDLAARLHDADPG